MFIVKRFLRLAAALLLLFPLLAASAAAEGRPPSNPARSGCDAPGQDGSPLHPYLICSPEDLARLHVAPDAHFELRADLDLSGTAWTPVPAFSGKLDGRHHAIANLQSSGGLFGVIEQGGVVTRLKLEDAVINGYYGAGMLAVTNRGTVRHVEASGTVTGRWDIGGLVGTNEGVIRSSRVSGTVRGDTGVGGIAAANTSGGDIRQVRADVTIHGSYYSGGIAGTNSGTITRAAAHGAIRAAAGVHGGIAGWNGGAITHAAAYNDIHYYAPYAGSVGLVCGLDAGTVTASRGHGQLHETP